MELVGVQAKSRLDPGVSTGGESAKTSLLNRGNRSLYTTEQTNVPGEALGGVGPKLPEYNYYELTVKPNDTITRLAIKYSITPFELRRANHLMRDDDLFSLKEIVIPVRKHGVIESMILQSKQSAAQSTGQSSSLSTGLVDGEPVNSPQTPTVSSYGANDLISLVDDSSVEGDTDDERTALMGRVSELRVLSGEHAVKSWSKKDGKKLQSWLDNHDKNVEVLAEDSIARGSAIDDIVSTVESTTGNRMLFSRTRARPWCPMSLNGWVNLPCLIISMVLIAVVVIVLTIVSLSK